MPLTGGPGRIPVVFGSFGLSYVAMCCIPKSPYENVSFIVFPIKEPLKVTEFQTSTHDCYVLLMCLFPGSLNASFGSPWGVHCLAASEKSSNMAIGNHSFIHDDPIKTFI